MNIKEQAIVLSEFFKGGRSDSCCLQRPDGSYISIKRPLTTGDFIAHLEGRQTIGVYLIRPTDNTVNFCAIDIDTPETSLLKKLFFAMNKIGLNERQFVLSFSGNKGHHCYVRFQEPTPAKKARQLLGITLKVAEIETTEIFPKQDQVPLGGWGSMIKIPCGIHQKSKKKSYLLAPDLKPADIVLLKSIERVTGQTVDEIIQEFGCLLAPESLPRDNNQASDSSYSLPCFSRIIQGVAEGCRDECAFFLGRYLKRQGFDNAMAINILLEWDGRNNPPLGNELIKAKVERVYGGQYGGFGCNNQIIRQFCSDSCPIKKSRKFVPNSNAGVENNLCKTTLKILRSS